jgi:hypothetical protein
VNSGRGAEHAQSQVQRTRRSLAANLRSAVGAFCFPTLGLGRLSLPLPAQRLQCGTRFRDGRHSLMFRPPGLLATQVAPTAAGQCPQGGHGLSVTVRLVRVGYGRPLNSALAATRGRVIVSAASSVLSTGQQPAYSRQSPGGHDNVTLMTGCEAPPAM